MHKNVSERISVFFTLSFAPGLFDLFITVFLLPAALLFISSGCEHYQVKDSFKPKVEMGDGGFSISIKEDGVISPWWESFKDNRLNNLIMSAMSGNFTIKQAVERIRHAEEVRKQDEADMLPEITAGLFGDKEWRKGDENRDSVEADLRLSWEIDLRSRLTHKKMSAFFDELAERESLIAMKLIVSADIAETYFTVIEDKQQLALLERQIASNQTLLELIELRFAYGEASPADVYQQRGHLAFLKTQLPVIRAQIRTLENRIDVLTGRSPGVYMLTTSDNFPQLPEITGVSTPSDLLTGRPDLRIMHAALRSLDHKVGAAVAEKLPLLIVGGGVGARGGSFSADGIFISLLSEISQYIMDHGKREAEVQKQKSRLREELYKYTHAYLTAFEEVENALWLEAEQIKLIDILKERTEIARANLRETRNRYLQGLTDYLPVLNALQSLQELEHDIIKRNKELISIRIMFYKAIGGGL